MLVPNDSARQSVAIIGAGLAGLSAAYDLGKNGFQVTLVESGPEVGGLASSFKIGGAPIERFYHFICRSDTHLIDLVDELGIGSKLHWRQVGTGYFIDGRMFSFDTPFELLRFSPVPLVQRFRFGLHVLRSRYLRDWRRLEHLSAKEWLVENIGAHAYASIWEPLLRIKFGDDAERISAAWIWHRIWRVASSRGQPWERNRFGYLEQGSSTVINALVAKLKSYPNVRFLTNTRVVKIDIAEGRVQGIQLQDGQSEQCDHAISTVPLPVFAQMAPGLPTEYRDPLSQIKYIGVMCMLFRLRESLTNHFWVNIHDPLIPFNGFIQYTNLNPRPDLNSSHIVYVPFYAATSHAQFQMDNQSLFDKYVAALQLINPTFNRDWVEEYYVFRETFAQAICPVDFSKVVPSHETPVPNLYITDSVQFYPEDRTISAAIRLGRHTANLIAEHSRRNPIPARHSDRVHD